MVETITRIPLSGYFGERRSGSDRGVQLPCFLAGPENALVETAVHAILAADAEAYYPVVFYGAAGTGKSHLAHGLAAAWKAGARRRPAVLETSADFARALADAIEAQGVPEFHDRYCRAALWILEDVERLAGKPSAQAELVLLLDRVLSLGTAVVVTSAAAPGLIAGLGPRLQGRLSGGLAVGLAPPSLGTRRVLLREFAQVRGATLDEEAEEALAAGLCATAPRLFGAMLQLEAQAGARDGVIGAELARRYLARQRGCAPVELRDIAAAAARHFALRMSDLRSPSRRKVVVYARGVAMYLARELTRGSLNRIGQFFGGRDHATVLHGCRKTDELAKTEPAIRHAIQSVRERLQGT